MIEIGFNSHLTLYILPPAGELLSIYRNDTLVAIIGTTILVPYLYVKSLQLIWR